MRTLCIIDMQPYFYSARDQKVIEATCQQIRKAKRYGWPVILVEYKGCGRTHRKIVSELEGYKKKYVVVKDDTNGSRELLAFSVMKRVDIRHLRVCGVESDVCVTETTKSLLSMLPRMRMELVRRGCNNLRRRGVLGDLKSIKGQKKNVTII